MAAKVKKVKETRYKLNKDELIQEYFEDMECLGCVTTVPNYQFAHQMNILLDADFTLFVPFENKEDSDLSLEGINYPYYQYNDALRNMEYTIICNRNKTNYLMKELPKLDYILLLNGMKQDQVYLESIIEKIKQINIVSYVFRFDPMSLKTMENLIL